MAAIEAQVRREFADQYPALAPDRWYPVNQTARELDSDSAHAVHVQADGGLVEVATEHIERRKVGEAEEG